MTNEEINFFPIMPIQDSQDSKESEQFPSTIPLLPLKNTVLFPSVVMPISITREKSLKAIQDIYKTNKIIGVVAQKDNRVDDPKGSDINMIGTIAKIIKFIKMPDGTHTVIIQGKRKFSCDAILEEEPYFKVAVSTIEDVLNLEDPNFKVLQESIREISLNILKSSSQVSEEGQLIIRNIDDPIFLINFVATHNNSTVQEKQMLLELNSLNERAINLMGLLQKELEFVELKEKVVNKTKKELDKQQKEYFLNQQIKSIKEELGSETDNELSEMRKRGNDKKWGESTKHVFNTNLSKLEKINPASPEYSISYNYLDFMVSLPWNEYTVDYADLKRSEKILNEQHYGMHKIKNRILEYLAVLQLKGDMKGPILCLVGPPGIGKTSLAKSIADAMGRKYIRFSLGGLHDESEIRGHRKTYIGAMPGRILQHLKRVKSSNPVMVLDEIDKVGSEFRGDPTSALIEVLDPEQNHTFYDNYLETEYDLSKILFIATANSLQNVQPALRDRLEIIDLTGYALEEKLAIAKNYLIPKQKRDHGLEKQKLKIPDQTILKIIECYTHESGVRELDRQLANLMRSQAKEWVLHKKIISPFTTNELYKILGVEKFNNDLYKKISMPGVAVGLAWTYLGGEILFIETVLSAGKGELRLTGNLGNVMKESATTALSFIQSHAQLLNINPDIFTKNNIHIHVPEGATPKDGPSAGITILTALISAMKNKKVKPFLAMTGEITLRGQVLPVGGIKEKILAAKRAGLKEVILCSQNEKDVQEIKSTYIKDVKFYYVKTMQEVLDIAIT
ncbi:MAG: endopeptidase La [Phycisphaerales bacterium]|nr:endopeptidase La [Phycisphaerales bacterium]